MEHDQQIQKMLIELTGAFTQEALSNLINVPQGTISKIKNGRLKNFSHKKAESIRSFYLTWKCKQQKSPVGQN
jgi:predicted XRE-type DNA-binding protein